ncbi:hypothetical protein FACS1894104_4980 [Actinomycetota bacterium]|nr:hypothetical protein FACS1894104_4980 [Actinomycetota bacterium]
MNIGKKTSEELDGIRVFSESRDFLIFAAVREIEEATNTSNYPADTYANEDGDEQYLEGVVSKTMLDFLEDIKKKVAKLEKVYEIEGLVQPKQEEKKLP